MRSKVNFIASLTPAKDVEHRFYEFEAPHSINGYNGGGAWRVPQVPDDPVERLLWQVSDEGQRARPWLPTTVEQDDAWLTVVRRGRTEAGSGCP